MRRISLLFRNAFPVQRDFSGIAREERISRDQCSHTCRGLPGKTKNQHEPDGANHPDKPRPSLARRGQALATLRASRCKAGIEGEFARRACRRGCDGETSFDVRSGQPLAASRPRLLFSLRTRSQCLRVVQRTIFSEALEADYSWNLENRLLSDSARVGCAKTASRSVV
jgi:hypothetical protein